MIAERTRRRGVATLVQRLASGGAILGYHSVLTTGERSGSSMHVPLDQVIATVRLARSVATIVPLRELLERHRTGRDTSGLLAITFDDAYASLARAVVPLAAASIPATLFVVTGAAREGSAYWWDRVEDLAPRVATERWQRFERECGVPDAFREGQPAQLGRVRPLRQWILAQHAGRWPEHLEAVLTALETEHGERTIQRSMTFEELERIAATPDIELGVHTRTHPVLPRMSDEDLLEEIRGSFRELLDRHERVLPVLAIPFGLFDARTLRLAGEAGMMTSLTLTPSPLQRTAIDALPRFCMTRGHTPWKVLLRTLGCWPGLASRNTGGYPALPSATT